MATVTQELLSRLIYKPDEIYTVELDGKWFFDKSEKEIAQALIDNNGNEMSHAELFAEIQRKNPYTQVSSDKLEKMYFDGFPEIDLKKKVNIVKHIYYKEQIAKASRIYGDNPTDFNLIKLQDAQRVFDEINKPEDDGSLNATVERLHRQLEESLEPGILTYPLIDETLGGGIYGNNVITIGARPSVGKSAYAINLICQAIAKQKDIVIDFFSLEMSKEQTLKRFMSRMTEINSYKLRNPNLQLTDKQKSLIVAKSLEILETNLRIHDQIYTLSGIEKQILRRHHEINDRPYLAIVDYLGLVEVSNTQQMRHLQVGDITRTMKKVAGKLNIPIILLSQLNRAVENRQDKKPTLADLRESGSVEQDSSIVMFLHEDEETHEIILTVAKNREGITGEIRYRFLKSKMYFEELTS